MGKVISFYDGREIEFKNPEVMDNFGSVIGMSFEKNSGKIEIAMGAVEVTRILDAVRDHEKQKDKPNQDLLCHIEDTCDELMEEGIEIIAKCLIAQNHAKIEPSHNNEII